MNDVAKKSENPMVRLHEQLQMRSMEFSKALPKHIPVERFMRVVLTAIQMNPKLLAADRPTLFTSAVKAAQDGLLPDGREGALVIYNMKIKVDTVDDKGVAIKVDKWIDAVQWMPMIAGIRKKVRNSKEIAVWDAKIVHEKDEFYYEEGLEPILRHKPYLDGHPGELRAAYSIARLKTGEVTIDVMPRWQIDRIRALSKSKDKGPWADHYDEMAKKTVARRHSKVLPMSTDLDDLIRQDDALYDLESASDKKVDTGARRPQLSDFSGVESGGYMDEKRNPEPEQEAAAAEEAAHNPETGEILDKGDEATADDYGPPEAMAAGRKARDDGIPKRAPAEFRDNPALQSLAAAWLEGWMERDKEIEDEKKAARATAAAK